MCHSGASLGMTGLTSRTFLALHENHISIKAFQERQSALDRLAQFVLQLQPGDRDRRISRFGIEALRIGLLDLFHSGAEKTAVISKPDTDVERCPNLDPIVSRARHTGHSSTRPKLG